MGDPPRELRRAPAAPLVRVLTVDDQPLFRDAARALILAMPGFEVLREAASGEIALELCTHVDPDMVLLDINLPGIDGLEVCRRLAERENPPVIVLISADDDLTLHDLAPELGANVFIPNAALSARALRGVWDTHGQARRGGRSPV
jgi:DNA-binding NarL/FixJ family response regulator